MAKQFVDIAIIGAMKEEVEALLDYLVDIRCYQYLQTQCYVGKLVDKTVVVFQSGVGKVAAALATAFVIEHFSAKAIINIGSAGGLDPLLYIGDIVVSSEVVYHDVDVTLAGFKYGQVANMPLTFTADAQLVAFAKRAVNQLTDRKVKICLIGSGDIFMSDLEAVERVIKHFPHIMAVDMEAAAIGHTCYLYNCPFVVIRAISDKVMDEFNKVDFFTFLTTAAKNSAAIVFEMIKSL